MYVVMGQFHLRLSTQIELYKETFPLKKIELDRLCKMTELISIEECKKIVFKAINKNVNSADIKYELSSIENSFGYIGDFARLSIYIVKKGDGGENFNKKLMFFVKFIPLDENGEIRRSELTWMFEREAFMYSEILLRFNVTNHWQPKCYLARNDVLVLEDLILSGFKHLKHRTRFDRPLVECVLRSVASMHADSIAFESKIYPKLIGDVFGCYADEFAIEPDKEWFQMGLEAVKAIIPLTPSYHRYSEKYSTQLFDELVSPVYEMVKPSAKYRNVVCHQDLWAGNIMFKFEQNNGTDDLSKPLNCVLMDYQFVRYLPPVADVLMFILMTTRLDSRRKNLLTYYRYYYDCLCAELEKRGLVANDILSWNDFQCSCEELKLFPLVFNCVALPFTFFPNEIQMKIKSSSSEEFQRMREVNHHDYIIQYMEQDAEFKDVVLESIEELMETLFL